MHNLDDKICPLIGKVCLLKGCTFFNVRLDGCEIGILNYNLYQLKHHIQAQLEQAKGDQKSRPKSDYQALNGTRFPQPIR
jgi:hypothetical protein